MKEWMSKLLSRYEGQEEGRFSMQIFTLRELKINPTPADWVLTGKLWAGTFSKVSWKRWDSRQEQDLYCLKGLTHYNRNLQIEQSLPLEIISQWLKGKHIRISWCLQQLVVTLQPANSSQAMKVIVLRIRVGLLQRSKCIRCQYFIIQSYFSSFSNMKAIKRGKSPWKCYC